jgi:hypothetical protein
VDIPMSAPIHKCAWEIRGDRSLGALERLAVVAPLRSRRVLPMSRYDIADYLGLAVETVSRALTGLRQRRVIAFRSVRQVRICDRAALEGLAEKLAEQGLTSLQAARDCARRPMRNKPAVELMSVKAAVSGYIRISTPER